LVKEHEAEQRSLKIAIVITVGIMILELLGGYFSNSLSLFSDAWHMFTDASALILCFISSKIALRPPTQDKTFGYYRVEILTALINGLSLLVVVVYIFYESIIRLIFPIEVKGLEMFIVTIIGLFANLLSMTVLEKGMHGLNVKSAFLHVLSDTLSSVGVVGAAIIIYFTQWYFVDPLMSIMVGIIIVYTTGKMLKEVFHILLEGVPSNIRLNDVVKTILSVKGVKEVHDIHIWSITSYVHNLTAHLVVNKEDQHNIDNIMNEIKNRISNEYGITHTTIQIETEDYREVGYVHRTYGDGYS